MCLRYTIAPSGVCTWTMNFARGSRGNNHIHCELRGASSVMGLEVFRLRVASKMNAHRSGLAKVLIG